VNAALSSRFPLEVLDRIRQVDVATFEPCLLQCAIEQCARWPDKGVTLSIFLVAGLALALWGIIWIIARNR